MKTSEKLFFLPTLLLLIAFLIKLASIPNHVIVFAFSFLLILVYLIIFLSKEIRSEKTLVRKVYHILFFVLILIVLVLPYLNMFSQGIVPILIYFLMALGVFVYFFNLNKKLPSTYFRPNNYRNFVYQNLVMVILNSPFSDILPDKYYSPEFHPKYAQGAGPEVYIDEMHNNYHTSTGLYTTFANILKKDGYTVKPFAKKLSKESLNPLKILVISNALHINNADNWGQPVYSAFEEQEIVLIKHWVENGGSLFLIADHPPFSSASKNLATAFGFEFTDGTALPKKRGKSDLFSRENSMLLANEITNGTTSTEYVDSIVTFTGQAFKIPDSAKSILSFNESFALYSPKIHNDFANCVPEEIVGYSQGAYMNYGKGKLVVFGEAAMFSGQLGAGLSFFKVGMNSPKAKNNYKLLLNIVHWLDK
ncbi:MAG: hypothetical protein IPN99_14690 [Bacteroidetes bacterium]|nr:hypothetical protein [Bacteroidota bacterium]